MVPQGAVRLDRGHPLNDQLIGFWPLTPDTGPSDIVNGYDGTWYADEDAADYQASQHGTVKNFSGGLSIGTIAELSSVADLTVSAWIQPRTLPTTDPCIFRQGTGSASQFLLDINNGSEIRWYSSGDLDPVFAFSDTRVPVLLSASLGGQGKFLYKNGVLVASTAGSNYGGATTQINIGTENGVDDFDGMIWWARLWRRALNDQEHAALFDPTSRYDVVQRTVYAVPAAVAVGGATIGIGLTRSKLLRPMRLVA